MHYVTQGADSNGSLPLVDVAVVVRFRRFGEGRISESGIVGGDADSVEDCSGTVVRDGCLSYGDGQSLVVEPDAVAGLDGKEDHQGEGRRHCSIHLDRFVGIWFWNRGGDVECTAVRRRFLTGALGGAAGLLYVFGENGFESRVSVEEGSPLVK